MGTGPQPCGCTSALTMRSCVHRFQCRWLLNIFSHDSSAEETVRDFC